MADRLYHVDQKSFVPHLIRIYFQSPLANIIVCYYVIIVLHVLLKDET